MAAAEAVQGQGPPAVAQQVQLYQLAAMYLTLDWIGEQLAEQGLDDEPSAVIQLVSLLSGIRPLTQLIDAADPLNLGRLVHTLVTDAARTARQVDMVIRPNVGGFVRVLNPPSCKRCVILAGRVYRYSEGFRRHPQCDCLMLPVGDMTSDMATDPWEAYRKGWVSDFTKAERQALDMGANMGRVVNATKVLGSTKIGGSVFTRGSKQLTPFGIFKIASDRAEAIRLLTRYGYIRD